MTDPSTRRRFLGQALAATGLACASDVFSSSVPSAQRLPRWRGFNLLEKFTKQREANPPFRASDIAWMSDWGFDFARLPMSYLCWTDPKDARKIREEELIHIDDAIELGRKHSVHVNLNFHRAPGYCVNPPKEPLDLWSDTEALELCAWHWRLFAKRYKGISNSQLSFDLLNEPPDIPPATYARVVKHLVAAIRAEDPGRLIVADGLRWGRKPVPELAELGIAQSTRGYDPMQISHYQASWVHGSKKWPEPHWPLRLSDRDIWTKERLLREHIRPWKNLETRGVGVHVGEWGAHNRTPHKVALAWMEDQLTLWKEAGWGWALWNLRGSFGVLNSKRTDIAYEDFRGEKLDRPMLDLLRRF